MKITFEQNLNNIKHQPAFKAGVTNLYSDFDGTYMPIEYKHDVLCRDGFPDRDDFLANGKKNFQDYFDRFKAFLSAAKGDNSDKFNFTLTTGRNRPEYNYYMKRIRQDGLNVPIPDQLIVNNGCDIYTPRRDMTDFFQTNHDEAFLKTDFVQAKRSAVKQATNGWDGDKFRGIIKSSLTEATVFEADTDGHFYGENMVFRDKVKTLNPRPATFVAIRDDGDLGFHLNFSEDISRDDASLKNIQNLISSRMEEGGVAIHSKVYDSEKFAAMKFLPSVNGDKISKVFDTEAQVERIIKGGLNDLVVTAGDGSNDIKMLDLFEYIDASAQNFSAENLRKIYNLPVISIFVDNSSKGEGKLKNSHGRNTEVMFDKIDSYFNSDGNIRFIHVDPTNPLKPQNLQDATQLAIREYAKRNKKFRNKLPKQMQELIEKMSYEYPIDKKIVKKLEEQTGVKLWNPAPALKKPVGKNKIIFASALALTSFCGLMIHLIKSKNKQNPSQNTNSQEAFVISSNIAKVFKTVG